MTATPTAITKITAVVPTRSEIGPTMMIGRKLATETSIPRTPKTRPRTSSGRSSWSCVCDGMATSPYAIPAKKAMTTTTASSEVTPDRSRPPGASARWRKRLIGPAAARAASRIPSTMRLPSMTRRRAK